MSHLEDLFQQYRDAELDENGENDDRIDILSDLENHLPSSRILRFLAGVISDREDFDMARIEAMRIASLAEIEKPGDRVQLADALESALADPHELIQRWAGNYAVSFIDVETVFDACAQMLLDRGADLDARHNCLFAIQTIGPTEQVTGILQDLVTDEPFELHAKELLWEWDRSLYDVHARRIRRMINSLDRFLNP